LTFTITGPTITTISPNGADTGGAAFTLTVNGSNFLTGLGGPVERQRPANSVHKCQPSQCQIPASDIAVAGQPPSQSSTPRPAGRLELLDVHHHGANDHHDLAEPPLIPAARPSP